MVCCDVHGSEVVTRSTPHSLVCGLLATPDVDDPLVPEVPQIYLEDHETYRHNARLYTKRLQITRIYGFSKKSLKIGRRLF